MMIKDDPITPASDIENDVARATEEILGLLGLELRARGSVLAVDGALDDEFESQTRSILEETFRGLLNGLPDRALVSFEYGAPDGLRRTGEIRANQDFHPSESLMAAEALFGVALPVVARVLRDNTDLDTVVVAQALHHAVWRRFPPGAMAYVDVLRMRLSDANQESRNSVSRELHDRVAHGIAAGIQRLELATLTHGTDTHIARSDLDASIIILRSALEDVQNIAYDLRQRVGGGLLDDAIRDYIENSAPLTPPTTFASTGSRARLAASVAEESFTIVLEAIRNARNHAPGASEIAVSLAWEPGSFTVTVADDGPGFDPCQAPVGSLGIVGMRERAATIGATLDIESTSVTTRIILTVPMPAGTAS